MSTTLNGFSINIINDAVNHFKRDEHNYYSLPHLTEYKIALSNNRSTRCDAEVFVDGLSVGTWRIDQYETITIERPADVNRKFIFAAESSPLARQLGVQKNSYDNGLIKVIFRPEKINICRFSEYPYISTPTFYNPSDVTFGEFSQSYTNSNYSMNDSNQSKSMRGCESVSNECNFIGSDSLSSGATILGSGTDQYFNEATPLTEIDNKNITTINIRLVVAKNQPYVSLKDELKRRPMTMVPPRIEDGLVKQMTNRMFNNDSQ